MKATLTSAEHFVILGAVLTRMRLQLQDKCAEELGNADFSSALAETGHCDHRHAVIQSQGRDVNKQGNSLIFVAHSPRE